MEIKDYPVFDVKTAKGGESVYFMPPAYDHYIKGVFVTKSDMFSLMSIGETQSGSYRVMDTQIKKVPLFLLECDPVFVGDKVFHTINKKWYEVTNEMYDSLHVYVRDNGATGTEIASITYLTLTKPKETKTAWVNVYKDSRFGCVKLTKEDADCVADYGRVDCVKIIWEE